MIENLNKLSFAQFGEILDDRLLNRGFPYGQDWVDEVRTVHDRSKHYTCFVDSEAYMDFVEGMAILKIVYGDGLNKRKYFYLDKPICLKQGVYFAITPFDQSCTVKIAHRKDATSKCVDVTDDKNLILTSKLELKNIYTLFYQEKEKGFFFKGEQHNLFELTYVDKNKMNSVVNGQNFVLEQGEMMLYGPNQWHMQYADSDCFVSFLTITFDMNCPYSQVLLNKIIKVNAKSVEILRSLISEALHKDFLGEDMILCKLKEFLINILRQVYSGKKDVRLETNITLNNENQLVDSALKYITDNVYNHLTVGAVAKAVNISATYLATLFKKHLQISPSEYITRVKLAKSKELIKEGNLNFTQIADLLKYSSIHHFSRKFKSRFGITPTEYSKALK